MFEESGDRKNDLKAGAAPGCVLDEDPAVRLVTTLVDCTPDQLSIGARMTVTFRPLSFTGVEGELVAPMFTLAEEEIA